MILGVCCECQAGNKELDRYGYVVYHENDKVPCLGSFMAPQATYKVKDRKIETPIVQNKPKGATRFNPTLGDKFPHLKNLPIK